MTAPARLYLAYGSNVHPLRLGQRLPGARLVARIEIPDCQLCFHKRGQDGSGKCNLVPVRPGRRSFGALYRLAPGEAEQLDRWERGYHRVAVELTLADSGERREAFTYLADMEKIDNRLCPFDWYRALVRAGFVHLGFPALCLDHLERQPIQFDDDPPRSQRNQALLKQLWDYNHAHPTPAMAEGRLLAWRTGPTGYRPPPCDE